MTTSVQDDFSLLAMPPLCRRGASLDRQFSTGELVSFNGYTGKVCGYVKEGLVSVSFGRGRFRAIPESELSVFVPWWSERD